MIQYVTYVSSTLHHILTWLGHHEGPLAYIALGAAAMVEYIFPPFPGDTITVFGVFLTHAAKYRIWLTYLAVTLGSTVGACVAYGLGHALESWPEEKMPRWLSQQVHGETLNKLLRRFEDHGNWLLIINRFIPAFRGLVFFAAGMTRINIWRVIVFGTLSAAAWNGLLFVIGYTIARNWHQLAGLLSTYSYFALGAILAVIVLLGLRKLARSR